jgi:hypothetical protein
MRWFGIRRANTDKMLRSSFERYGVATLQGMLAGPGGLVSIRQPGGGVHPLNVQESVLPWLTEQYDRAERKETWSLTMEAAITLLVAIEVTHLVIKR